MLHLGDIAKINGAEVPTVNVIIGGSPCQDLSVAGKRAGLSGERSGLLMEQLRIIKEMRRKDIENGAVIPRPRYMVWENVPGAFSSNKGEDFRIVLEETAKVVEPTAAIPRPEKGKWTNAGAVMGDGWAIAWRVFDAQFWGVPQRRRRIALVADFGGDTAPEILFERKSVRGYTPPRETPWKDFAAALAKRIGGADKARGNSELAYCIQGNCIDRADTSGCNGKGWTENVSYTLNTVDRPTVYDARGNGDGQIAPTMTGDHNGHISDYTTRCVRERCGCEGGGKRLLVQEEKSGTLAVSNDQFVAQTPKHNIINATPGSFMNFDDKGLALTLRARDYKDPQYVCLNSFDCQSKRVFDTSGVAPTLASGTRAGHCNGVIAIDRAAFNQGENAQYDFEVSENGVNSTLTAKGPSAVCGAFNANMGGKAHGIGYEEEKSPTLSAARHDAALVTPQSTVRRLTPLECERLQGFPDGWTDIDDYIDTNGKKRKTSDTARYKALGNSIALPSWVWVLERLSSYCSDKPTMASLFDGIGGFPLIWETLNGKGTCLWASEIDEFPIAVTKRRFS